MTSGQYIDDLQQQSKKGKKKDEKDKQKATEFRDKAMETLKISKLLLTWDILKVRNSKNNHGCSFLFLFSESSTSGSDNSDDEGAAGPSASKYN